MSGAFPKRDGPCWPLRHWLQHGKRQSSHFFLPHCPGVRADCKWQMTKSAQEKSVVRTVNKKLADKTKWVKWHIAVLSNACLFSSWFFCLCPNQQAIRKDIFAFALFSAWHQNTCFCNRIIRIIFSSCALQKDRVIWTEQRGVFLIILWIMRGRPEGKAKSLCFTSVNIKEARKWLEWTQNTTSL